MILARKGKKAYYRKTTAKCGHPSDFICFYFYYAHFPKVRHFLLDLTIFPTSISNMPVL